MNKSVKMIVTLTVLGALAGIILAVAYRMAEPLIRINREKELKAAIFKVLPGAEDYKAVKKKPQKGEEVTVYVGLDNKGRPVGFAFKADGNGFQGNVGVMVGLGLGFKKLRGIEILDQVETPGLGNRILEKWFKEQFKGVEVHPKIEYIKYRKPEKPNQIQAITGATISSNAVVTNINNAVKRVTGLFTPDELLGAAGPAPAPAPAESDSGAAGVNGVTDGAAAGAGGMHGTGGHGSQVDQGGQRGPEGAGSTGRVPAAGAIEAGAAQGG